MSMFTMKTAVSPLVSIVVPVFNDEETIAAALDSAIGQTLSQIEIIVIDDASSDRTTQIVQEYAARDARIRLIRQPENRSAFQARREGILAAQSPYVLFLDGDDELDRYAAARSATTAEKTQADLVQFGIQIVYPDGTTGGSWEGRSQPKHGDLEGEAIVVGLFPHGKPAAGQLWKYLFRTEILRAAYAAVPADGQFFRANDLPIAFLVALIAKRYVSIPDKLYRYFWRRGASTVEATTMKAIDFQVSAIDAFDTTSKFVLDAAYRHSDPQTLLDSHASARASIISTAMRWALDTPDPELYRYALDRIRERVETADMVRAAARYQPTVLGWLAEQATPPVLGAKPVKSVMITSANITTGGVSMVVLAQARFLASAGIRVTIAARRAGNDTTLLPDGVSFYEVTEGGLPEKLDVWARICAQENIDAVIDHRILYAKDWHAYALMAAALGIPTIGWIHSFAGRPVHDLSDMHSHLRRTLPTLAQMVTLSPLDVAFWKLLGLSHTAYLPNPPSPMILEHAGEVAQKEPPRERIELIWIGRMEQHTKQVRSLLNVAAELRRMEIDFRLRVIGPDSNDYSAEKFNQAAEKSGLSDAVEAVGPLHGAELIGAIDIAHAFVGTSVIEGYQLTITEVQSRGLPVFMYEMPWLVPVRGNDSIVSVPQGDAIGLARRIAAVFDDADAYEYLSRSALSAARRAQEVDYPTLYRQLVNGELPKEYSPVPTLDEAGEILGLTLFFAERHAGLRQRYEAAERDSRVAKRQKDRADQEIVDLQKRLASVTNRVSNAGNVGLLEVGASNAALPRQDGRVVSASQLTGVLAVLRRPFKALGRWTDRAVRVVGGKVRDGRIVLRMRVPRGQEILGVELYRDVDGEEIVHRLAISRDSAGTMLASRDLYTITKRRWQVRATVRAGKGEPSVVGVLIHPDAPSRGDGTFRVRFPDDRTVQVYEQVSR